MAGKSGPQEPAKSGERIAKVMARAGLCSRREAEAWIAAGRVAVNGKPIASPALDIQPRDNVTIDGQPLRQRERTRLFLYHKPRGLLTSHADARGRPTIFAALPKGLPRLISIGRLDLNTEGLLLLTNDGGLARTLELPQTGWLRRYRVRAHGRVRQEELDRLYKGITIEGVRYGSIEAKLEREQGANSWLAFAMREGKNREVKNVLGHLGLAVNRLIRISFGPFQLGELAEGAVDEVKTRVLRDQLGDRITALSGADFSAPIVSVFPATGVEAAPERRETEAKVLPGERGAVRMTAKPAVPATPKRKPGADKKRRRDAERFGEPELARRDKRRGHGPAAGKRRAR
jgi:23S rRNA pseudouridine2605 synthase